MTYQAQSIITYLSGGDDAVCQMAFLTYDVEKHRLVTKLVVQYFGNFATFLFRLPYFGSSESHF